MDRAAAHAKLMLGVTRASVSVVEQALSAVASVDGISGLPPLCVASNHGYVDIIKLLIDKGADLEVAAGDGRDSTGNIDMWFDGGSNIVPLHRSRALHAAIYGSKLEAVQVLLEAGANPNSTNASGATPLMIACGVYGSDQPFCEENRRLDVLHALLSAGADPLVKAINGGLAIHFAAALGAIRAIEVLLQNAPSTINAMDMYQNTPLSIATVEGQARTVSFLLSAGARESAVWTPGIIKNGALYSAVERNRQDVVLDEGLDATGGLLVVPQAMRTAIRRGFTGILGTLLSVQGEQRQGFWANHPVFPEIELWAAEFPAGTPLGRVHAILAAKFGTPILHYAARFCSLRATHVLLSAGAVETAVDKEGKRAIDVVGDLKADDMVRDAAKEDGLQRMLQRGPAFRARSWTWTSETDPAVGVAPGLLLRAARCTRPASMVRIFRGRRRGFFIGRCAR